MSSFPVCRFTGKNPDTDEDILISVVWLKHAFSDGREGFVVIQDLFQVGGSHVSEDDAIRAALLAYRRVRRKYQKYHQKYHQKYRE